MGHEMKQLKFYTIIGVIFVLATGSLAHFLYGWLGNNHMVGLFTPVNESIWEHMKLLFFPMLLYSLFIFYRFKSTYPCVVSSFCFGILTGTWLIPALYYAYTYILGKNIFLLDIGTFLLSTISSFGLSYRLSLSCRLKPYTIILAFLIGVLFACFVIFSYSPPGLKIFRAPA